MRHTNVDKGITKQQQVFIDEYIIDFNGTRAAEAAKYSKKTARVKASQLLTKVNIQEAIQKALKKRQERTQITADKVLNEYAKIAFSNIGDYAAWSKTKEPSSDVEETGVSLIDSDKIERDKLAAVESVAETKDGLKIKLHNKLGALDALARHLGIDKTNTIDPDEDESDTDELVECLSGSGLEEFADFEESEDESDECED